MDVEVRRAAVAVQVEHAARLYGRRPELDRAGFDRDGRRMTRGEDVVALVRSAASRLPEVVVVRRRADDREDQPWDAFSLRCGRARDERERDYEKDDNAHEPREQRTLT